MEELKPCPFCGGEAEMIAAKKFKMEPLWPNGAEQPDEYNCWVKCKKCHTVCGAVEYPTEAEAAAAWNRRAAPENKPLTCEGCAHESDIEFPCDFCSRNFKDRYAARKPEGSDSHA